MKIKDRVHGRAIERENDRERRYNIGMDSVPKIKGIILRSRSGLSKG
jgi:hypothetical protein